MSRYDPSAIEARWQARWEAEGTFVARSTTDRPKYYVLEMFPYPSGRVHMGHVRNYTMGDVIARYRMACGFNVLHPMGWDAFGMPAENAAIQNNAHPQDWTRFNIAEMKAQMKPMGWSLDWSRELATCEPEYYGQQQALFIDMMEAGLIYRKNAVVNWDPVDMTVLANEQVIDGRGWRSGAEVERRELTQWFFRISAYSDELLTALDSLDNWPAKVRLMQANWIGKSRGLQFGFDLPHRSPARRRSRFTPPAPIRCWGPVSSASRPITPSPARSRPSGPRSRRFAPWHAGAAPPKRPSRRRKSWGSTPVCGCAIRCIRTKPCRSGSPISS